MFSAKECHLPTLDSQVMFELENVGEKFGRFNPFDYVPFDFSTIRRDGRIIPCTIRLEENKDNRLYWLSLGETELALYFYNDPKHFEEEIIGATERQNYWCVEVTDLFSVERGKGYATMLSKMRNQLLIACSEYNRIPIYAYLEDGSYTGWTSAAAKSVGFQQIPHLLYRREKENFKLSFDAAKRFYKWYEPKTP